MLLDNRNAEVIRSRDRENVKVIRSGIGTLIIECDIHLIRRVEFYENLTIVFLDLHVWGVRLCQIAGIRDVGM